MDEDQRAVKSGLTWYVSFSWSLGLALTTALGLGLVSNTARLKTMAPSWKRTETLE